MIRALVSTLLSRKGAVLGLTEASLKTGDGMENLAFWLPWSGLRAFPALAFTNAPRPGMLSPNTEEPPARSSKQEVHFPEAPKPETLKPFPETLKPENP